MKKLGLVSLACMLLFAIILIGFSCTGGDNKSQSEKVKPEVMMSVQNGAFLNHRDSVPSKKLLRPNRGKTLSAAQKAERAANCQRQSR